MKLRNPFSVGRKESPDEVTDLPDITEAADPHGPVVSFYADGKMPIEKIRDQLAVQYKDGGIVDSIASRVEQVRASKATPEP